MGKTAKEMSAPEGSQANELMCSYASLLLADCGAEVSADSMNAVISAAGGSVPASYSAIWAKVAGMKDLNELVEAASKAGGGGGGGDAPAAAEKKKTSSSSDDGGGGGAMFEEEDY